MSIALLRLTYFESAISVIISSRNEEKISNHIMFISKTFFFISCVVFFNICHLPFQSFELQLLHVSCLLHFVFKFIYLILLFDSWILLVDCCCLFRILFSMFGCDLRFSKSVDASEYVIYGHAVVIAGSNA